MCPKRCTFRICAEISVSDPRPAYGGRNFCPLGQKVSFLGYQKSKNRKFRNKERCQPGGLWGSKYAQMADFSPPEISEVVEISVAKFCHFWFFFRKSENLEFFQTLRGHIIFANNYFSKRLKSEGDHLGVPNWPKNFRSEISAPARNFQ